MRNSGIVVRFAIVMASIGGVLAGCAPPRNQSLVVEVPIDSVADGSDKPVNMKIPVEGVAILPSLTGKAMLTAPDTASLDKAQKWNVARVVTPKSKLVEVSLVVNNVVSQPVNGVSFTLDASCEKSSSDALVTNLLFAAPLAPGSVRAYNFKVDLPPGNRLRDDQKVCGSITGAW